MFLSEQATIAPSARRGERPQRKLALRTVMALCALFTSAPAPGAEAESPDVVVREVKGKYADIKEQVLFAIENRGLVLNYVSHIGAMLGRTGRDIGRSRVIYRDAELLEFCSATVSRGTMEADPRNIVFCPYSIALYTLPDKPGAVFVAYRKPGSHGSQQSAEALRAVGRLLDGIVDEALK